MKMRTKLLVCRRVGRCIGSLLVARGVLFRVLGRGGRLGAQVQNLVQLGAHVL